MVTSMISMMTTSKTTKMLTTNQLQILQHALGVDQYGRFPKGGQYRNFFCAGGADEAVCRELVALGYMVQHKRTEVYPYFNCSVTDEGRKAMFSASPNPPKLTPGKKRYQEYRNFADAFDCTFGEWLQIRKTEWYREMHA